MSFSSNLQRCWPVVQGSFRVFSSVWARSLKANTVSSPLVCRYIRTMDNHGQWFVFFMKGGHLRPGYLSFSCLIPTDFWLAGML